MRKQGSGRSKDPGSHCQWLVGQASKPGLLASKVCILAFLSLFSGASFRPSRALKNKSVWRQPIGSSSGVPPPTVLPQLPCPCLLLTFLQTYPGGAPIPRGAWLFQANTISISATPPLPIFGKGTHISFSSHFFQARLFANPK